MNLVQQTADRWADWAWAVSWQFALFVVLVAVACWLLRRASPRLRHALWLLAFVKILLPPSLAAPWSFGRWPVARALRDVGNAFHSLATSPGAIDSVRVSDRTSLTRMDPSVTPPWVTLSVGLMLLWASVITAIWIGVWWRYRQMSRLIDAMPTVDEGPLRIGLERQAQRLGIRRSPDLHLSAAASSPYLFGILRPRIVLPKSLVNTLSSEDIQTVLLHELVHWRRRDTWIGLGQVIAQGLLWFHPLVWWASAQLRNEREQACDDTVVRLGAVPPERYGEVIVRVLTAAGGRSVVADSWVGVFERGARLQQRLEEVMKYDVKGRTFGGWSWAALGGFALLFLPMGISDQTHAQSTATAETASEQPKTADPQIVRVVPKPGQTGVTADLNEISITFDRDMGKGMSWTGGGKEFPPVDDSREAKWINDRTCVLPVKLKRAQLYRVGINSTSYQNFRSAEGVAVDPIAIVFTTEGASKSVERRVQVPQVVEMEPANHATDVDPATTLLRVTFDSPMGEGVSWTGGGEQFPKIPDGKRPRWSKDRRTCRLPVSLEADHEYRLGLNSKSHKNFQSRWGVPLSPVVYEFKTTGE